MATRTYSVPDISCGHCKSAIEEEVGALSDVATVLVNIEAKTVTVDGEASDEAIHAAIEEAGYEVAAGS
ncbi:MAG: copper chaperone [Nitriliruptor sp.]|nr:MAG: copper chaperone [Nitriliruptor sp.]